VRDCDLKELAMPDLDQIKQAEQGARDRRGRFARGQSGNPEGRAAAATTSTALLAGEGEALTRKAVELGARRRPGGIAAVPRTHRRAASRTYGRIHDAGNPQRGRFGGAKA
jgi:hypothetical protein